MRARALAITAFVLVVAPATTRAEDIAADAGTEPAPEAAVPTGDVHLLRGARHFREGRFAEALVEFRVAERLSGEGEATWYTAATLTKLGRAAEASASFARAEAAAPGGSDLLFDYYRAVAANDARLYLTARRLLERVIRQSGHRVAGEAHKLKAEIDALFRAPPSTETVDWYYAQGTRALERGEVVMARLYLEEARALAALRKDEYRAADVGAALAKTRQAEAERERER